MRANRGTLTEPGKNSPFRDRSVEENLDLFRRMRAGEFPNGARVLRAKIDMASRQHQSARSGALPHPARARIRAPARPGSIYPSYDFAHGQSDAIEGITHSICTLEFEDHRPLYDWFIENLPVPSRPHQYEFARLNLTYTVLSKRVLTELVRGGHVEGWDDPRMPTLAGLAPARRAAGGDPRFRQAHRRRQGQQRGRCRHVRVFGARSRSTRRALRRMAVLRPLKVVIENYPEGQIEELEARQSSRRSGGRHAQDQVRPRALHRAATISWRTRRRNSSGFRPAPRCGCATPISSPAARW